MARVVNYIIMFLAGLLSGWLVIYAFAFANTEQPFGLSLGNNAEAPGNWINEKQIQITDNQIIINVANASLSSYAATGSMKPVLDKDSNGIRIIPKAAEQINVGDVVTYEKNNELIVHRVIEKGQDETGEWFIVKGDNNQVDDGKIYFNDIRFVTIGVLW